VPIGIPAANAGVTSWTNSSVPFSTGVIGEMYLAGDGLARATSIAAQTSPRRIFDHEDPRHNARYAAALVPERDIARWSALAA